MKMSNITDLQERFLRHYLTRILEPAKTIATNNQSDTLTFFNSRTIQKNWRVVNWTHAARQADLSLNSASLLPLLIALTFPSVAAEHLPHVMQCLVPFTNKLLLPNFPTTWGAAYSYAISQCTTDTEEILWRTIGTAVKQFYLGWSRSRKFQQSLIKRLELFLDNEIIVPQCLTESRSQGLLGLPGDRVTVFNYNTLSLRPCLTIGEIDTRTFDHSPLPATLPKISLGQELLQIYNGYRLGVYHVDNYLFFNLPVMTYDTLSTGDTWSMLPNQAYAKFAFSNVEDFGMHYVPFRDILHANFDKIFTDISQEAKARVLKKWCDKHLEAEREAHADIRGLIALPSFENRADRLRVVNVSDVRKKLLTELNRQYIKSPPEKRAARKALLNKERTIRITASEQMQLVAGCNASLLVTGRHGGFYLEASAAPTLTPEQKTYFSTRINVHASHITVESIPFISLDYLSKCHDIGIRTFESLSWIPTLIDGVFNGLSKQGISSIEDWKTQYEARIIAAEKSTRKSNHTVFTRDDDLSLWNTWKRYMHGQARTEALALFPNHNERHLVLRGRLMSQLKRKNKTIDFLYDTEGLKKFLGKQYSTYSAVIN